MLCTRPLSDIPIGEMDSFLIHFFPYRKSASQGAVSNSRCRKEMVSTDMSNQGDAAVEISFMQRNLVCSFRSYSWLSLKIVYELYFEIFASFNAYNGEE